MAPELLEEIEQAELQPEEDDEERRRRYKREKARQYRADVKAKKEAKEARKANRPGPKMPPRVSTDELEHARTQARTEAVHVPPQVVAAFSLSISALLSDDLSDQKEAEAIATLQGAIDYWASVRLTVVGPYMPEVALGCAIVGTAVIKVRRRRKAETDAKVPKQAPMKPEANAERSMGPS